MKLLKTILTALLALLLLIPAAYAETGPDWTAELQSYLDAGDYAAAVACCDAAGTPEALARKEEVQSDVYARAVDLTAQGDCSSASLLFAQLGAYRNAQKLAYFTANRSPVLPFMLEGVPVTFGSYVQSGKDGEPEPLTWLQLSHDTTHVFLISEKVLDCWPYHNRIPNRLSWENSFIRQKLNDDFLNAAFTEEEKAWLAPVSDGDLVSLPAEEEMRAAFPKRGNRICRATKYAEERGVWIGYNGACYCLLKDVASPAKNLVRFISLDGSFSSYAARSRTRGVRPVICIDLKKVAASGK